MRYGCDDIIQIGNKYISHLLSDYKYGHDKLHGMGKRKKLKVDDNRNLNINGCQWLSKVYRKYLAQYFVFKSELNFEDFG